MNQFVVAGVGFVLVVGIVAYFDFSFVGIAEGQIDWLEDFEIAEEQADWLVVAQYWAVMDYYLVAEVHFPQLVYFCFLISKYHKLSEISKDE